MAKRPRSNKRKPRNAKSDPLTPARRAREEDLPRLTTRQRIAKRLQAAPAASGEAAAAARDRPLTRSQQIIRAAIVRIKQAWHRAGSLTSEKGFTPSWDESPLEQAKRRHRASMDGVITGKPPYRFNQETRELFKEFGKKGIDHVTILQILQGKLPPHTDFTELYLWWKEGPMMATTVNTQRRTLPKMLKSYRSLKRMIQTDPALTPSLKRHFYVEHWLIQKALRELQEDLKQIKGEMVGLDKALSRQRFWTPLSVALVELWKRSGHSSYRAVRDIAKLFSRAFPSFPDDHTLVERRYYQGRPKNSARK